MNRKCPLDQLDLILQDKPVAGVFRCGTCSGLWLPTLLVAEQLKMPEHGLILPAGDMGVKLGVNCPEDESTLVKYVYQGVELDICSTCRGVWLDRGELDYIQSKLMGTVPNVAPAEPLAVTTIQATVKEAANTAVYMAGNVTAAMLPAAPDVIGIAIDVGVHAITAAATNPQVVDAAMDAAGAVMSGVASVAPQILESAAQSTPEVLGAIFELIGGLFSN